MVPSVALSVSGLNPCCSALSGFSVNRDCNQGLTSRSQNGQDSWYLSSWKKKQFVLFVQQIFSGAQYELGIFLCTEDVVVNKTKHYPCSFGAY